MTDANHPTSTTLFFAGTDTDVGKTYVAALVAQWLVSQGKRVAVYKPVASGCHMTETGLVADDATALWQAAGCPGTLDEVCPQRFLAPLAPPEAAAREGRQVDPALLTLGAARWQNGFDVRIVEGAGGLMSPLADHVLNIDLAKDLDATLIIVAANRLGVIHQVLATCAAAIHHGLKPSGIILNDPVNRLDESTDTNANHIRRFTDIPVIATVTHQGTPDQVAGIEKLVH